MKKIIVKDKSLIKRNNASRGDSFGSLRVKIIIMFLVFFIIIMVYHTYFETPTISEEKTTIPKTSDIDTIEIFQIDENISTYSFHNPTIAKSTDDLFLMGVQKLNINGTSEILLFSSKDGRTWSELNVFQVDMSEMKNPKINYVNGQYFVLLFESNGNNYITTSNDGQNWTAPELSGFDDNEKSVYYETDFLLVANQTGLWILNYNELQDPDSMAEAECILKTQTTNASLLKLNDDKYMVIYENNYDGSNTIALTTITFSFPEKDEPDLKWDLLIIFIILGIILLFLIVKEVAHD